MKALFLSFFLFVFCLRVFSQSEFLVDGKLPLDSLYLNASDLLISQYVFEFSDIRKDELIKKTKNWGATKFVNLKEVLVGETEDQLVFNYIDNKMYMKTLGMVSTYSWYVRMVVQFKDGKMRVQYFDDGNTFQNGSQYGPALQARSIKLKDYFKETDGVKFAQKPFVPGMLSLKKSIIENSKDLESSIRTNKAKSDDW